MLRILILLLALWVSPAFAASSGTLSSNTSTTVTVEGYNSTAKLNTLYLAGTFGGGTVTVEGSPDGGTTWVAVQGYSYTSASIVNIAFRWTAIRLTLSGAVGPSLTWWVL